MLSVKIMNIPQHITHYFLEIRVNIIISVKKNVADHHDANREKWRRLEEAFARGTDWESMQNSDICIVYV